MFYIKGSFYSRICHGTFLVSLTLHFVGLELCQSLIEHAWDIVRVDKQKYINWYTFNIKADLSSYKPPPFLF